MNTETLSPLAPSSANDSSLALNRTEPPGRTPLFLRVLLGVLVGIVCGWAFGTGPILLGITNQDLGELGMLVIRLLKALAVPLVFFAILDSLLRTRISGRHGWRMVAICLVNVSVAFAIGLTLMNTLAPGELWRGTLQELTNSIGNAESAAAKAPTPRPAGATLNPLHSLHGYVPHSLIQPFQENSIIAVIFMALLTGAALRHVQRRREAGVAGGAEVLESGVHAIYLTLLQMLEWIVQLIPWAVCGLVAQLVGRSGLSVFVSLWALVAVIAAGLLIHSLLYYPLVAWVAGGKSPRVFLGQGADAIITGISTNSSLATVPVTLSCLTEKMAVSQESARLSACIGTNLNNDGITLYEAMAALFLMQAFGLDLTFGQQAVVVLASLMTGIGVAGVPEAGLIVLPLVLSAAGLPDALVAGAIPLLLPVDWILARLRSGVNVMSDMVVAILLDRAARP